MRSILLTLAGTFVVVAALGTSSPANSSPLAPATALSASHELQQSPAQGPPKDLNIDINVNRGGGVAWYRSPVWIAIGALAFVVLLLVIILAARGGGGTTIVRE
jgi:hypothetical protein